MSHGKKLKGPSYREVSQMILNANIIYNPPTLKVKKLFPDAKIPQKSYPTDSGYDLYAYRFEQIYNEKGKIESEELNSSVSYDYIMLYPLNRVLVNTGVSCTVGVGYEIQIRPRSGLSLKQGLTVCNTPGTIDEQYRGMIGVIIVNLSNEPQKIELGTRIAQMVVCPVMLSSIEEVKDLNKTDRDDGGFQSTGLE